MIRTIVIALVISLIGHGSLLACGAANGQNGANGQNAANGAAKKPAGQNGAAAATPPRLPPVTAKEVAGRGTTATNGLERAATSGGKMVVGGLAIAAQ